MSIAAGVEISIEALGSQPIPCSPPLTEATYSARFQVLAKPQVTLVLTAARTVWLSTGNLLNATDPCQPGPRRDHSTGARAIVIRRVDE